MIERRTGLRLPVALSGDEAVFVILLIAAGSVLSIVPALLAWRTRPADALRG